MMEKFRNLSKNIFFKIFLLFLGLTFVIFTISDFLLGNSGSWIAKIDGHKISYSQFVKTLQSDKESISRANPQEEVIKYLDSDQFKNDVLGRMITKSLIKSLQQDFGIYANKDLILKQIAEDPNLKGQDGKFDRNIFRNLLARNGLTEEKYIESVQDETVGTIIVHSLIEASPSNLILAKALYKNREEKRTVDVVTVSMKNIGHVKGPNDFELNDFFEKNKAAFALPEMRKVSYIVFDRQDLPNKATVSEEEIENEYKNNNSAYQKPETRDFYHLLFDDKKAAEDFIKSLKQNAGDKGETFIKLAEELQKKDKKSITLQKVAKKDLFKEISDQPFALQKGQNSAPLKSTLGYHVFYVNNIVPASKIAFTEVKDKIKNNLLVKKTEDLLKNQLNSIGDEILASNSLEKISEKFGLKINKDLPKFDDKGFDSKSQKISELKTLEGFVENSFNSKKQQTSKLFYSKSNDKYYIIFVESIEEARQRSLDEVRVLATDMWIKQKKQQELQKLADDIANQIQKNNGDATAIISKNNLKIEKNREFPRAYMIDIGGGKKVPYSNKFLEEIFTLKPMQVTSAFRSANDEYSIGILKGIKTSEVNDSKAVLLQQGLAADFKNDILVEYNKYIQNKFPVEINQKLLQGNKKDDQQK